MSKTRIISLVMVFAFVLLSICSCKSYDRNTEDTTPQKTPTQNVIDEISLLSDSSSIEEIARVQELYNSLLDSEKEQISNYDHLLYCKECVEYKDIANRALDLAEKDLSSLLKNPQSLQVHSKGFYAYKYKETTTPRIKYICVAIDYSAQNGFGGYNRDTYYVVYGVSLSGELEQSWYDGYWNFENSDIYVRYNPPYEN